MTAARCSSFDRKSCSALSAGGSTQPENYTERSPLPQAEAGSVEIFAPCKSDLSVKGAGSHSVCYRSCGNVGMADKKGQLYADDN